MKYEKPAIDAILEHYGASSVPHRNGWFSIKCPFHDDKHASATANRTENVFCCFACQTKGDGFAIIMQKEGVKFREAISIAQRILESRGEVLRERDTRGGGLSRRTRNNSRGGEEGRLGRRTRPNVGA
jgi:DNA primase